MTSNGVLGEIVAVASALVAVAFVVAQIWLMHRR